jgi:multimeric flavodoxin WrbA
MNTIRVLAISASPRRHGNSETLLDWVLEEMRQDPAVNVTKVVLIEANVAPCRGCNACEKLNACINHDGMDILHDQIIMADCIILAAPIYCMSICAQAKALVDRAQVFRSRKYVLKLPVVPQERIGKRFGIFLSTAGQDWEYVFDAAIPVIKCFFNVIEVKNRDLSYVMIRHVDEKGAIKRHPTAHKEAASIARSVLTAMKERLS